MKSSALFTCSLILAFASGVMLGIETQKADGYLIFWGILCMASALCAFFLAPMTIHKNLIPKDLGHFGLFFIAMTVLVAIIFSYIYYGLVGI